MPKLPTVLFGEVEQYIYIRGTSSNNMTIIRLPKREIKIIAIQRKAAELDILGIINILSAKSIFDIKTQHKGACFLLHYLNPKIKQSRYNHFLLLMTMLQSKIGCDSSLLRYGLFLVQKMPSKMRPKKLSLMHFLESRCGPTATVTSLKLI